MDNKQQTVNPGKSEDEVRIEGIEQFNLYTGDFLEDSAAGTPPPAGAEPPPAGAEPPPAGAEPPPAGAEPPPAGAEPPPAGAEPPPAGAQPPPAGAEPPPAGAQPPPAGAQPPPAGEQPPPAGEQPPPAGEQGVEARLAALEQENARLRREKEAAAARIAEVQRAEELRAKEAFIEEKYTAAVQEIDELDPDDPDYHKSVAKIWAKTHRAIDEFSPEQIPAASELLGVPAQPGAQASPPAGEQAQPGVQTPPPAAGEQAQPASPPAGEQAGEIPVDTIRAMINERLAAKQPGFGSDDPAFVGCCRSVPTHDENGAPIPIERQIDMAIENTRRHYDAVAKRVLQVQGQPMARGSVPPAGGQSGAAAKPPRKVTLGDIIDEAVSAHTL